MPSEPLFQLPYPYNLLTDVKGSTDLELPGKWTTDVQAGFDYVLSTLPDAEWELLRVHYAEGNSFPETAAILSLSPEQTRELKRKALQKLRIPSRWNYIRYGISGYLKRESEMQYRKGYHAGYSEGCKNAVEGCHSGDTPSYQPEEVMDLPITCLNLSSRAYNCLYRTGYRRIRDIASLNKEQIFAMRNLGRKSADEIAKVLLAHGITQTDWNEYLL